jgi:hypothetical protein
MQRRHIIASLPALLVAGCSTTPPQQGKPFVGLAEPEPGRGRLYVLRPPFESQLKGESPALAIDGTVIALLEDNAAISLSLDPGARTIALTPGTMESNRWNKSVPLNVEPGKTYFLALWLSVASNRSLTFVPIPGAVLPIAGTTTSAQGVSHEFVTREQAMEFLPSMKQVTPTSAAR